MASETVHLFNNRLNRNFNIYLLFIPILLFVLVLGVFISLRKEPQTAAVSSPDVLGEEANP